MTFRENLRYLMDCKGIQTKELAQASGISENTIKSYLKENSAEPKISKAILLAQALGVSVELLATGTEEKHSCDVEFAEIVSLLKYFKISELRVVLALVKAMKQNCIDR